jgi:hypothetical protein
MLYNIVSPLIFFTSAAGIIVILSRALVRGRHQKQSSLMTQSTTTKSKQQLTAALRPAKNHIHLAKNKLALTIQHLKDLPKEGRELLKKNQPGSAAHIVIPHTSWREKLSGATSRLNQAAWGKAQKLVSWWQARRAHRRTLSTSPSPVVQPTPPTHSSSSSTSRPAITITSETARVQPQLVSPLFFKRTEPTSPLLLAEEALQAGRYPEVESLLVPHIMKHVKDTAAYLLLGRAALGQENWPEAAEIFEQVLSLDPNRTEAHAPLGYAAFQAGHLSQALPHLQRAIDADPTDLTTLHCLLHIAQTMDNSALKSSVMEKINALESVSAPAPAPKG